MFRVKICGVTTVADAQNAIAAGADAIGMVCYAAAPRCIDKAKVAQIAAVIPDEVTPVLLFVNAPAPTVTEFLELVPQAWLQFHGNETPQFCTSFNRPYLIACTPEQPDDITEVMATHPEAAGIVCDGGGGQGKSFAYELIPAQRSLPLVLAGGLTPSNVALAIEEVQPDAVDTSSGVCVAGDPLRKDERLLQEFVAQTNLVHV